MTKENKMTPMDRLVWWDIETTGLSPRNNLLLEIGVQITDLNLNTIGVSHNTIWSHVHDSVCDEKNLDPYIFNMHTKNGLLKKAKEEGLSIQVVEDRIYNWLYEDHMITNEDPFCGSSVEFDHAWIEEWMPSVSGLFSYRNINISSLKELCKRYNPVLYKKLEEEFVPAKYHRVLDDIEDTIQEFRFYRDNFLFWKD